MTQQDKPYIFNSTDASLAVVGMYDQTLKAVLYSTDWGDKFPTLRANDAPPILPGQVWVVHACPGEGKSLLKSWWIREIQKHLADTNANAVAFDVCLEESIEISRLRTLTHPIDFQKFMKRQYTREDLVDILAQSADDKIIYVGPSVSGALIHPSAAKFSGITPSQIGELVYDTRLSGVDVAALSVDYMQLLDDDEKSRERLYRISNASTQMTGLAKPVFRCPILITAQSDLKGVKGRQDKQPRKEDIQDSSQITKDADIVWSMWKPISDYALYSILSLDGHKFPIFDDLVIVRINKWRGAHSVDGKGFVLCFGDPVGEMFEPPMEVLRRVDVDRCRAAGITSFSKIRLEHLSGY